jgi:hypothetical protein
MFIKAGDVKVGYQLAESDGFLFDVVAIEKETARTITLRLKSDFSSHKSHIDGVSKTFNKNTLLEGIAEA